MLPTHSRRYHLLLMPQPHHRFNSLKASHEHFQHHRDYLQHSLPHPQHLTKRHSLDSRPSQNAHKHSVIDNAEDYSFAGRPWASKATIAKGGPKEDLRVKYFWRGKGGKSKKEEKGKSRKVKRTWSELGKQFSKKEKHKYASKSKYEDISKINISDRLDTKNDATHGKSTQSYLAKREPFSGERMKLGKSVLNSTMLTKRQSEERRGEDCKYQDVIWRLKETLEKYERKVKQLRQQKQFYRLKLKKERRKKVDF